LGSISIHYSNRKATRKKAIHNYLSTAGRMCRCSVSQIP
jgi:hypothetical protein